MLDQAINHGKEHRQPYRKAKAASRGCRNHGNCPYCLCNRKHSESKRRRAADQAIREYRNN